MVEINLIITVIIMNISKTGSPIKKQRFPTRLKN